MAATLTTAASAGKVTVTGTGHAGTKAILTVSFVATNGRRNHLEARTKVPVTAGAINYDCPMPYTAGTVVVTAISAAGAVIATSAPQAV